ncbi:hypothetical protein [Amycolatopsis methanolica]|uniref:hypothetical protein n=1 Tax=Amycolatopsis methanolica TaxID=1814 RepID=UPI001ADF56D8|nr:hypothetical protein [Amycolatopsis methanolica]
MSSSRSRSSVGVDDGLPFLRPLQPLRPEEHRGGFESRADRRQRLDRIGRGGDPLREDLDQRVLTAEQHLPLVDVTK